MVLSVATDLERRWASKAWKGSDVVIDVGGEEMMRSSSTTVATAGCLLLQSSCGSCSRRRSISSLCCLWCVPMMMLAITKSQSCIGRTRQIHRPRHVDVQTWDNVLQQVVVIQVYPSSWCCSRTCWSRRSGGRRRRCQELELLMGAYPVGRRRRRSCSSETHCCLSFLQLIVPVMREVEASGFSSQFVGSLIISKSCFFRSVESPQPQAGTIPGEANLCNPFAPMPLTYSSEKLGLLLHRIWA